MTNLSRKTAKIFGETAITTGINPEIGQFGSAKAGTYVGTNDIDTIQGLPAWSNGWVDAVTPTQQFPTLPEMTGVHNVLSYQEAYLLQKGIAEWDSGTTYYTGDFCKGVGEGKLYVSKVDSNINHAVTDSDYWEEFSSGASRNIGEIVTSTIPLIDAGLHLLDGALISGSGSYSAFIDYIADLYTDNPNASYFAPSEATFTQPTLSANGTLGGDSFAVSASDEYSTSYQSYQAWQAFDDDVSTNWLVSYPENVSFPVNLIIYNPTALKCSSISITTRSGYTSTFTAGVAYGSNDNSTWTTLNSFTNNSTDINSQYTIDLSSNINFYKYYKIAFTEGRNDSGTSTACYGLAEVKLNATYQISSEQWWQDQVTTYGVCDKFVYDSNDNTVRLPKYGNQIFTKSPITASTVPVKGNGMNIGYTNGTENFGMHVYNSIAYADKPAYGKPVGTAKTSTYPSNKTYGVTTDGSKSGIIADTSSLLTQYPLNCYYYIVIATSTKTQIEVDIDEIATDLNSKMDKDGTNADSSVKFADGQWVRSTLQIADTVTYPTTTSIDYDLSSYLPNDNYNYEVLISSRVITGNASGNQIRLVLDTELANDMYMCGAITRTSSSAQGAGTSVIPVGQNRIITVGAASSFVGTFTMNAVAYRRIGTNS